MNPNLAMQDPAHQAWRRYDHYRRLEGHGQPRSWHGRRGWIRAIAACLALLGLVAYGFRHRFLPDAYNPTVHFPSIPAAKPAEPPVR